MKPFGDDYPWRAFLGAVFVAFLLVQCGVAAALALRQRSGAKAKKKAA